MNAAYHKQTADPFAVSSHLKTAQRNSSSTLKPHEAAELTTNVIFGLFSVGCNLVIVWQNQRILKEVRLETMKV
ncbi:hypothetical protein CHU98_g5089 [Xylaria longipes]|nr:hypothetical protein CHU98_g5089 [Xylaria longipes]